MKFPGRHFMVALFMVIVTSMTFAQTTGSRDLQTELTKFWPSKDDQEKNVWQLFPVTFTKVSVYPDSAWPSFEGLFGSQTEEFTVKAVADFDSDFYKQFSPSLPTVKGSIYYITARYRSSKTYIAIVQDNRILDYARSHADTKDSMDRSYGFVTQADFEKSVNKMGEYDYPYGVPIYLSYKDSKGAAVDKVISPNMIVNIFEIAHSVGNFMEAHTARLDEVRLASLDKTSSKAVKIVEEFKNDYLYPVGITFVFSDEKKEGYQLYKTSSGGLVLAQLSFFLRWQP